MMPPFQCEKCPFFSWSSIIDANKIISDHENTAKRSTGARNSHTIEACGAESMCARGEEGTHHDDAQKVCSTCGEFICSFFNIVNQFALSAAHHLGGQLVPVNVTCINIYIYINIQFKIINNQAHNFVCIILNFKFWSFFFLLLFIYCDSGGSGDGRCRCYQILNWIAISMKSSEWCACVLHISRYLIQHRFK